MVAVAAATDPVVVTGRAMAADRAVRAAVGDRHQDRQGQMDPRRARDQAMVRPAGPEVGAAAGARELAQERRERLVLATDREQAAAAGPAFRVGLAARERKAAVAADTTARPSVRWK